MDDGAAVFGQGGLCIQVFLLRRVEGKMGFLAVERFQG